MSTKRKPLYLENGLEFDFFIRDRDGEGKLVPVTGLVGVTGIVAAADNVSTAIDATLSIGLTERAQAPGRYFGRIGGAILTAQLNPGFLDQTVYTTCVFQNDIRGSTRRVVRDERPLP